MTTGKRVFLVTGGAGFIGANLCRRLIETGQDVHSWIRPGSDLWRIRDLKHRMTVHQVDITDSAAVRSHIAAIRPTVIYHLATHGAYPFQNKGETILLTNIFGLWNLLNACNEHGYELFVNTGSSSEYGAKSFAMRETDILEPNSYYAVAKSGQSLLCQHLSRMHDLPIVSFRPFSVYGPYEEPSRLIPQLCSAALEGRSIDMVSPETCRDFVYVDDVVDAYLNVDALSSQRQEIFNVGSGVQTSLKQIVNVVERVQGRPVQVRWGQMEARTWDTNVWVADISKIHRLTGWRPKTSIHEGIKKCLTWFESNVALYRGLTHRSL